MNRFLADHAIAGAALRCACAALGCAAVAGAVAFSGATSAQATVSARPEPRDSVSVTCRQTGRFGEWYRIRVCEETWRAFYRMPRKVQRERGTERRTGRSKRAPRTKDSPPPAVLPARPSPRPLHPASKPAPPVPSLSSPPSPAVPPVEQTPAAPATGQAQADMEPDQANSLRPLLMLGLLLPVAAAAVGYPLRRRIHATAGALLFSPPVALETSGRAARFTYRPAVDPFAVATLGLAGPGAADATRVIALAALEECGDTALVVIPRPDAIALFGLTEDELLDETAEGLFIPGNLDAALAYIETEFAVRRDGRGTQERRLLLVADVGEEAARIGGLASRHPGDLSAVLLGDWSGDQTAVDDDGLVQAPSELAGRLPERFPAMSRSEARDRLHAVLNDLPRAKRRSGGSKRS
ncbi:hypothetical protein ACFVH6_42940 [Spirillospora sp. NPDC127200]